MTFTWKKNDKNIYFDNHEIFVAPAEVLQVLTDVFDEKAVVFYNGQELFPEFDGPPALRPPLENRELHSLINRNIVLIDKEGKIVWRIENDSPGLDPYGYVKANRDGWQVKRDDGFLYDLEMNTGKVSNPVPAI